VSVDLEALANNLGALRERIGSAEVLAVVKADAYGHGAVQVAHRLSAEGVRGFGVAFAGEGVTLREGGVTAPILVLGPTEPDEHHIYSFHDLTPTISGLDQLRHWQAWAEGHSHERQVHLKVDTGMSRLGLGPEEVPEALDLVRRSRWLALSGFLSHLADADEPESPTNPRQARLFEELLGLLTEGERSTILVHLANSSGALHLGGVEHSLVRLGLALFGLDPIGGQVSLEPVMRVAARVVAVRDVPRGARVGYGGTWEARRASRLAVVPIGYGDGYSWRLSNRGVALIGGSRAPVVGRISMDMTLVDVTEIEVAVGDEAVLLGRQGDESIDAWELASKAGTIAWETLCLFGLRLPRVYRTGADAS
jgi:alanine racemase